MTDNNNKEIMPHIGAISGANIAGGIGSTNSGSNSGGVIILNKTKKTCRICLQEVGIDHQNNCQCQKKGNYCGYCEENEISRKNCTCHTKKSDQKSETSSNQVIEEFKNLQVSKSSEKSQSFSSSQNQEILTKINHFLKAKSSFLQARQTTIQELKACCNELEKFLNKKHAIVGEVGNTISNVGGSITNVITFGIPKVIGESIKSGNNFSRIKLSGKSSEEFQIFLVNDENELTQFSDAYSDLSSAIHKNKELEISSELENTLNLKHRWSNNEPKLFNFDYKIFDILTDEGVWEGRPMDPEKMAIAIKVLNKNLKDLRKELDEQFEELRSKFGAENIKADLTWEIQEIETKIKSLQFNPSQEQNLQQQIMIKELTLEKIVSSVKEKLKSKSNWSDAKRKERDDKLEPFFKNLPANHDEIIKGLEDIKKDLSKKLSWNEIDSLCRTSQELRQLQLSLQNQHQAQIQIPSK